MCRKAGLNRRQMGAVGKALNGNDVCTLYLARQREAREFRHTVDHDGATAARPEITASFDTQRPDLIAKDIKKHGIAWCKDFHGLAVHRG